MIESKQTCRVEMGEGADGEAQISSASRRRTVLAIVALAFVVRLMAVSMVQSWPMGPDSSLWKSGPEVINIAQALASHQGFSSPFGTATGPTAWIPPVYPFLLSLVFLGCGVKTGTSAILILTMQAFFSALVCFPLYGTAKKVFDHRVAIAAAAAWALFPYAVLLPALFIWETALSTLLLTLLCYWSMQLDSLHRLKRLGLGVLWGMAALTNTALLALLPVFIAWHVRQPSQRSRRVLMWAPVLLACLITVLPWLWRDWQVLHAFVPIRSNFAEELWLGNHQNGSGRIAYGLHPAENNREFQNYESVGEVPYLASKARDAMQFISSHPAAFARLSLYRMQYWWYTKGESAQVYVLYRFLSVLSLCGIVMAFRTVNAGAKLLAICIFIYPVVYYLTDVYARYRYPVEPLMTLLATFFVVQTLHWFSGLQRGKSIK